MLAIKSLDVLLLCLPVKHTSDCQWKQDENKIVTALACVSLKR